MMLELLLRLARLNVDRWGNIPGSLQCSNETSSVVSGPSSDRDFRLIGKRLKNPPMRQLYLVQPI